MSASTERGGTAPDSVRRTYVDGRWGQIHLHVVEPAAASGRPLVCFHLSPGSGRMFVPFLREIGRDRLALAPDTAGYGYSDPPPEPPALEDYARSHGDVLDALNIGQVDLLGAHTGSRIAIELAHQRPEQVRRLVLIGAAVYTEEERSRQKVSYGPEEVAADGAHLARKWAGWSSWRWPGVTDEMVGRYVADSVRDFERVWWAHQAVFEHDLAKRLEELSQRTMVVCTKDDIWTPTLRSQHHLKNGTFVERPDWGHWVYEVATDDFGSLVRKFLDAR